MYIRWFLSDLIRHQGFLSIIREALDLAFFWSDFLDITSQIGAWQQRQRQFTRASRSQYHHLLIFTLRLQSLSPLAVLTSNSINIRSNCHSQIHDRPLPLGAPYLVLPGNFNPSCSANPRIYKASPILKLRNQRFDMTYIGRTCVDILVPLRVMAVFWWGCG